MMKWDMHHNMSLGEYDYRITYILYMYDPFSFSEIRSLSCDLYLYIFACTFHVRQAMNSVWKVQFLQIEHFSLACNEFFHMVCSIQKSFSTQNGPFAWILIHRVIRKHGQILAEFFIFILFKSYIRKSSLQATEKCLGIGPS